MTTDRAPSAPHARKSAALISLSRVWPRLVRHLAVRAGYIPRDMLAVALDELIEEKTRSRELRRLVAEYQRIAEAALSELHESA